MSDPSADDFKPYDQFILFGDSITQHSTDPVDGFVFQAALQEGTVISLYCIWSVQNLTIR